MVQSTAQVLEERGTRYGRFINQAGIAQGLHAVLQYGMQVVGKTRQDFHVDELEAVNMIVNKLARIYNGDNHYSDSWRDIAGYATLVADRLDNDTQEQKRLTDMKEQYERNRTPEQIKADRADYEPGQTWRDGGQEANPAVGSGDRPTGQPELRRLPVTLDVQNGVHSASTETEPGVPTNPGR